MVMSSSAVQSEIVLSWMRESASDVRAKTDHLTQLDSAIGDGDHGINMNRGFEAVGKALGAQNGARAPGGLLGVAGKTVVSTVGGASGPLWGSFFRAAGRALGDEPSPDGAALAEALALGVKAVQDLGAAVPGDKTMVDALAPAVEALREALAGGADLEEAAAHAAAAS